MMHVMHHYRITSSTHVNMILEHRDLILVLYASVES